MSGLSCLERARVGFPDTNRDSAAHPRDLCLSTESGHALELNKFVREIMHRVDQLGARQHPCTVSWAEKRELGEPRLSTRPRGAKDGRGESGDARCQARPGSQVSQAQKRDEGTGRPTGHVGAVSREGWRFNRVEEDGRARPRARIQCGPGLDVVRNLGVGKVDWGPGDGRAGSNSNSGGSALRSALTWLDEPVRGTWEGCGGHGAQGSGDPKPWTELLWRAPQDRVPQSQLMGQHPRTQPWTELLWRMPQDGVLRSLLICQNPHTRPHSQLWPLGLARKVLEPDSARRDSETASLPPAQSLPSSSDTGTGRRCCHGGCCCRLSASRVYSTMVQRTASESDFVMTRKVCSTRIQPRGSGRLPSVPLLPACEEPMLPSPETTTKEGEIKEGPCEPALN